MGIFNDLGFMNQSGDLTSPDCSKINGLTVNNLLDNCINALSYTPDSDGQISILGSTYKSTVNNLSTPDIFNDGSAILTYNLNNNVLDLGNVYNGTLYGNGVTVNSSLSRNNIFNDSTCLGTYPLTTNTGVGLTGSSANLTVGGAGGTVDSTTYAFNTASVKFTSGSSDNLSTGALSTAKAVSFWIKVSTAISSGSMSGGIIGRLSGTHSWNRMNLGFGDSSIPNATFTIFHNDVSTQFTYITSNIPAGWVHFAISWNSTIMNWDIYMNGVKQTIATYGNAYTSQPTINMILGKRGLDAANYTHQWNQLRIFSKVLVQADVNILYAEQSASDIPTYSTGKFGNALDFNGINNYIDTGYKFTTGQTDYTFSLWFKSNYTGQNNILGDLSGSSVSTGRLSVYIYNSYLNVYLGSSGNTSINMTSYLNNTFHHLVISVAGSTVNVYIDNVLKTTFTATGVSTSASPANFRIGQLGNDTGTRFNGVLDQIRIFKKALTISEVNTLYSESTIIDVPSTITQDISQNDWRKYQAKAVNLNGKLFINNKEQTVLSTTLNKPDFFGDSSNVATYLFDGNTNDSLSNNSSYYSRLGWFNTDAANTNPYMGAGTKTYDFGAVTSIKTLTTSASATNPSSYNTNPFVLYTSIDNVTWVEAFRTTVSYTTEIVHTLNINTRYLKIVASGYVFSNPTKSFYIEQFGFHGTPTNITYASGRFGQSAVFNGTSSISNIWNYSGTTNLTISFWIKIPALPINPNFIINRVSGGAGGIIDLFAISLLTTGALRFANEYNANGSQVQVDSSVIPVNTWTHIAFALGGISAVSYVNGVRISSSSDANWGVGARLLSNFPLGISKLPYTSTSGVLFTGALDNLRIFNRALSDSEVTKLYEEDTTTFAIEYGRDRTLTSSVQGTVDKVYIDTWTK